MKKGNSKPFPASVKFESLADLVFETRQHSNADITMSIWSSSAEIVSASFSFEEILQTTLSSKQSDDRQETKAEVIRRLKRFLKMIEESK